MPSAEERLDKAGASFKLLEKRVDELEKKFVRVMEIYDNRHKKMAEEHRQYLDKFIKESDELYRNKAV